MNARSGCAYAPGTTLRYLCPACALCLVAELPPAELQRRPPRLHCCEGHQLHRDHVGPHRYHCLANSSSMPGPSVAESSQLAWRHTGLRHSTSGKSFVVFEYDEPDLYINPTMKHVGTHRAQLLNVCLAGACQSLPRTAAHEQFAPWLEHHSWHLRGWQ